MLKFFARLLKELLTFFLVQLPLQLVGSILLLIYLPVHFELVLKSPGKSWKLPSWLRWFDCADLYSEFNRTPVTYLCTVIPQGWWATYCWLAWRNPCNYFEYKHLGYKFTGEERYFILGDLNIGDSTGDVPGLKIIELYDSNDKCVAFEYYYIKKYSESTCFRFRLGVKIGGINNPKGSVAQHVFVVAPFKSYAGI